MTEFRAPVGIAYFAYDATMRDVGVHVLIERKPHRTGYVTRECVYTYADVLYRNDQWMVFRLPHHANENNALVMVLYWRANLVERTEQKPT